MKKILFLTVGDKNLPSTRYRVYQWIPFLESEGWKVKCIRARHIRLRKLTQIVIHGISAKVIFIQKKLFFRPMLFLIALLNQNIIFDFDDALYIKETFKKKPSTIGYGSRKAVRRLMYSLRIAKAVIAGNEHLRNHALIHNRNVRVVPTLVNIKGYNIQQRRNLKPVYVGWIGTAENQFYLEKLRGVLTTIEKKYTEVTLKVISDKAFVLEGVRCNNIKWDLENYKTELSKFDIGIMPLLDDEWSRGKCAFKLIQYMASGIPVVASNVGANSSVVDNGNDGFLVNNDDEWIDRLSRLIESPELREKIGAAGRKRIIEDFCVEAWENKFESILLNEVS